MNTISDAELRAIVEKVVQRTLHKQVPHTDDSPQTVSPTSSVTGESKIVALGADHGGYKMKEMLASHLSEAGFQVIDCGTNGTESVDYPDFGAARPCRPRKIHKPAP